jgi:hypothetical protein
VDADDGAQGGGALRFALGLHGWRGVAVKRPAVHQVWRMAVHWTEKKRREEIILL